MPSFGTLQGQGRPHIAAGSMLIGLWGVSIPAAYLFGFAWLHGGLVGVWRGLVTGYMAMTVLMVAFVVFSDWPALALLARQRSEVVVRRKGSLSDSDRRSSVSVSTSNTTLSEASSDGRTAGASSTTVNYQDLENVVV